MPRGTVFMTERIDRTDTITGNFVRQITSFPCTSLHMHYETPTFTPDGERMIVVSMRGSSRSAPYDLFTMRSNGDEPTQLCSDAPEGMACACLTVSGTHALYMEGGTCHRTRLDDARDEEIGRVDGAGHHPYYRGARSYDGRYYFSMVALAGKVAVVRWDVQTGEHVVVATGDGVNHPKANPGGPEFQFGLKKRLPDGSTDSEPVCIHCETLEPVTLGFSSGSYGTAHNCWLGRTGRYHATLQMPDHGIIVMDRGQEEPELVASGGPYFWHSGASQDGKWIVADTNFPDEGIWLINVATRKRELLCFPSASQGHPQCTHPHPNLNDDGTMAVFTSDATGITQVSVVPVPEDMRERLSTDD